MNRRLSNMQPLTKRSSGPVVSPSRPAPQSVPRQAPQTLSEVRELSRAATAPKAPQARQTAQTPQLIIEGALVVMAECGLARMTTKRISEQAAVSTASIHYFFETKDNLIIAAFEHVVRITRQQLRAARLGEVQPLLRIRRMLEVFFDETQLSEDFIKIWPQFWVHAGTDQRAARLFRIYNARMVSNFKYDLCALGISRDRAESYAIRLNALHRGLWIDRNIGMTITPADITRVYDDMINLLAEEAGDRRDE